MRIPRLFLTTDISPEIAITLSKEQAHYIKNVLRRKNNDPLVIFNNNGAFSAKVIYAGAAVQVVPETKLNQQKKSVITKNLFQAACQPKKMELIIQKTTELGIDTITPVLTTRCKPQGKFQKNERWHQIAIGACQQAECNQVPVINNAIGIDEVKINKEDCNLLLNPIGGKSLPEIDRPSGNINIFIGPEGGFSDDEIKILTDKGCRAITFGPRIMRTETAAIAITAAINVLWGDCGDI